MQSFLDIVFVELRLKIFDALLSRSDAPPGVWNARIVRGLRSLKIAADTAHNVRPSGIEVPLSCELSILRGDLLKRPTTFCQLIAHRSKFRLHLRDSFAEPGPVRFNRGQLCVELGKRLAHILCCWQRSTEVSPTSRAAVAVSLRAEKTDRLQACPLSDHFVVVAVDCRDEEIALYTDTPGRGFYSCAYQSAALEALFYKARQKARANESRSARH